MPTKSDAPFVAECPPEQGVPLVTPFSQLGRPPESFSVLTLLGYLFVAVVLTVVFGILIGLLPLILLATAYRRIWSYHKCSSFHTPPSSLKIAVIGGGWSGIQIIARLKELGVHDITGFEKQDDLGGTWHPSYSYHSIQIHGAMWLTSFHNYPYNPDDKDANDGKVLGSEARNYVHRFAKHMDVRQHYLFNSKVVTIKYDSAKRTATLVLEGADGSRTDSGPFDFVVYASQASEPNITPIPGASDFKGDILHSLDFKTAQFEKIIREKTKVVVVGGSKAACDLVLCLQRAGHEYLNWVYRKPYIFFKYENMFHDRSFTSCLRGTSTLVAFVLALVSTKLSAAVFWCSGLFVTYGKPHLDLNKYHFGILCPKQRADLSKIPQENRHRGNPKQYVSDGIELDDGRKIQADCILLGTGCKTGMSKLSFEKDSSSFDLNPNEGLLNHFLVPSFPVFANSTALWTTFGPVRAVNSADMIVYHLCVREKLSETAMQKMTAKQLGGGVDADSGWLFQSKSCAVRVWLTMHLDLMMSGLVDFFDFLWHGFEVFGLGQQSYLRFDILPKISSKQQ